MHRRLPPPQPEDPELRFGRDDAQKRLQEQTAAASQLLSREHRTSDEVESFEAEVKSWAEFNQELLTRMFTTPKYAEECRYAGSSGIAVVRFDPESPAETRARLRDRVTSQKRCLESLIGRLPLIPESPGTTQAPPARSAGPRAHANTAVFIVHGHDEAARALVARFLDQQDISPVILHEQANAGGTIVEKIERYSEKADFAVVLLTPDDVGGAARSDRTELKPRARQNVILELGFFFGKLGRARVCALYKGEIDLPSDILGVVYIPMDEHGAWQMKLARELGEVGFNVDLNKLK